MRTMADCQAFLLTCLMMVSSPTYDPDELLGRERGNHYMELLGKMSYTNVTGYLWYVYKNDIKKV